MLTVRDMVDIPGVRTIAGERGLDRPVRWVHISELADPTPWLSGGELLLTTGMAVDGDGRDYLHRIVDHKLAGLGVGVEVGGLDAVPEAMAAEAEKLGFPIFEVPYQLPFIALTEKAFTAIVNDQAALLQRAVSAHERLERVALSERGLDGLASALGELVGGATAVLDARGQVLARHGEDVGDGGLRLPVPGTNGNAEAQAWLLAERDGAPLTELDRLIVHQAVTIVGLELLRRRVADDTERRLAGDVLASVLSGELEGAELSRRLVPFGLSGTVAALVIAAPEGREDAAEVALARAIDHEVGTGLAARVGNHCCALVPAPDDEAGLFGLGDRVRVRVGSELGADLVAGAGRSVALADTRRGYHEARWALESAALDTGGERRLFTYRDLGSFQLLLALQDDDALRTFCDSILSPLEADGTAGYSGELLRSLEVFIECNGQWERAARRLFCHRHTLRYRIQRVEQLTGRSLDSARDRIDFWLALRGRELLD
jgi:purine catabolism regulator